MKQPIKTDISKLDKTMTIMDICRWSESNWKITNLLKSKADVRWVLEEDYKDLQQENARLKGEINKYIQISKDYADIAIERGKENKILRQVLEEIKGLSKKKTMLNYCGSWLPMEEVFKIIDKALKGDKN